MIKRASPRGKILGHFIYALAIVTVAGQFNPHFECPKGEKGLRGEIGNPGPFGDVGELGDPGELYYPGGVAECGLTSCPDGIPGDKGYPGHPGKQEGEVLPGNPGDVGDPGEPGDSGAIGPPGFQDGDLMYLPYMPRWKKKQVCYSFRKVCAVPGLRNGWRAWYRKGQSGYMIYKKWMYFVTLSTCPCAYGKPLTPQPNKPKECVRLGECQAWE